jgi:hypothetical protein
MFYIHTSNVDVYRPVPHKRARQHHHHYRMLCNYFPSHKRNELDNPKNWAVFFLGYLKISTLFSFSSLNFALVPTHVKQWELLRYRRKHNRIQERK